MQRSRHRKALKELPPSLYDYWKSSARNEYHGIPTDAVFFARSVIGLLDFFECAAKGREPCALPSKAADSVWHAWLRLSPLKLETFCRKHFGRVVPHVEGAAMGGKLDDALAVCLVRARKAEGIKAEGPRLPALFLLDKKVKMPFGYGYGVLRGQPGYSQLDAAGRFDPVLACPPQLAAAGLLGAGLITAAQYAEFEQRARQQANSSGSSCGSGCGSSLDCSSSSSCDSGGSSCGSGCGGGGD
ncbi:hypothetical protein [Pseudoduganella sp.]|uniref:hypothetical protein n=1 Tax=Pseudoduganella sp. TaxID=1880898 RepID=UPI0035AFA24F